MSGKSSRRDGRDPHGSQNLIAGILSRGPVHRAASQQMQMQVIYRLPAIDSCIHHDPKTLRQLLLFRQLRCDQHQMPQKFPICLTDLVQRGDVLARNNQQMHRSLRMNVGKRNAGRILIDLRSRDFSNRDLAK